MADSREIALSELIGALSSALDVAEGEPQGHAARVVRDRHARGGRDRARRRGSVGPVLRAAAQGRRVFGELGAHGGAVRRRRPGGQTDLEARRLGAAAVGVRVVAADRRARRVADRRVPSGCARSAPRAHVTRSLMKARCHRGAEIARKLGFSDATAEAIRALDEHWDGRGQPVVYAVRRSRWRADPVPGPDGGGIPPRARRRASRATWPRSEAASGSTRARRRPGQLPTRRGFLGVAARAGPLPRRPTRPDARPPTTTGSIRSRADSPP